MIYRPFKRFITYVSRSKVGLFCSLLSASLLGGCLATPLSLNMPSTFTYQAIETRTLPPASKPSFQQGDRFYYTNGARDIVNGVQSDRTELVRKSNRITVLDRDIFQPEPYLETSKSVITRKTTLVSGGLWPLQVGKKAVYTVDVTAADKATGDIREYTQRWECAVPSIEETTGLVGTFDTFRVVCRRYNSRGRERAKRTWFYAPEIGTYVMRWDFFMRSSTERFRELAAIRPNLGQLEPNHRENVILNWQEALENNASGEGRVWLSDTGSLKTEATPTRTFRGENGQFCRSYTQTISSGSSENAYTGIACRTGALRWRTPTQGG